MFTLVSRTHFLRKEHTIKFRIFLTLLVIVSLISCIQNDIEEPYESIIDEYWDSGASYSVYNITEKIYCDSLGDYNNFTPVLRLPTNIIHYQFTADCGGQKYFLNTNIAKNNATVDDLSESRKKVYDFLSEGVKTPSNFHQDFSAYDFIYDKNGITYYPSYGQDSLFIEIRHISDKYESNLAISFEMEYYVRGYFSPYNSFDVKKEEFLIRQNLYIID